MIPTIHLNGTSREELIRQLRVASERRLIGGPPCAGERTAPHGRDYYPQGKGAIQQAQTEHYERLRRIDDVYEELMVIWTGIRG
jgi:hypothetical protein